MKNRPLHHPVLTAVLPAVLSAALCSASCGGDPATQPTASVATPPGVTALGLVDAPGHELVEQNCIACHSAKQFLQQRGDRDTWLSLIRWMQRDHGLWQLAPDVEQRILDYLATHYAPEQTGRRRPLPPELMPPNPYAPGH